jgi:[ribosomal protein S5]-alanine N-acetyltransferase
VRFDWPDAPDAETRVRRPSLLRRPSAQRATGRPADIPLAAPPDGHRVALRVLERSDREEFLRLAAESRELHRPWTYPPERADQFEELFARSRRDDCVCLLGCLRDGGDIAGVLIISQMVRGAFQSAYLGYYAHQRHSGRGYMREAMAQTVDHAFGRLALHRLEANIQPANRASIALARSAGFRLEGFSPRYLLIGGQWRDHERYAITAEDRGFGGRSAGATG